MTFKARNTNRHNVRSHSSSARRDRIAQALAAAFGQQDEFEPSPRGSKSAVDTAVTEVLEDRKLMSTVSLVDGVLTIDGAGDNRLRTFINYNPGSDKIRVVASGADDRRQSFPRIEVRQINVVGTDGKDRIRLASDVDVPANVQTLAGNDAVRGGLGDDIIDGGAGKDRIVDRGGNNAIAGGAGHDKIVAGKGNGTLRGDDGNDRLIGKTGDDTLDGGEGNDKLVGGRGNDSLTGGAGRDRFVGGPGSNTMVDPSSEDRNGRSRPDVGSDPDGQGELPPVETPTEPAPQDGNSTGGTTNGGTNNGGTNNGGKPNGGTTNGGATNNGNTNGNNSGATPNTSTDGSPAFGGTFDSALGVNAAPKPVVKVVAGSQAGLAQHTVNVNGTSTQFFNGDAIAAKFEWDFGDTGSKYNKLVGWNAAHTYDKPGTYTIKLTVTDVGGKSATTTTTVNIAADTRRAIYVDSVAGSDSNDGSSDGEAVKTLARAVKLAGDNTKILLKRGQTFDVPHSLTINGKNMLVGAYGTGSQTPIVRKTAGSGQVIFFISGSATGFIAQNLTLDSVWDFNSAYGKRKIPADAFSVAASNFTVRNSSFLNINTGVQSLGGISGVLVQGNYFGKGIRAYCIWAEGYDHTYLGNTMTESQQEHLIRADGFDGKGVVRVLIHDNDMSRQVTNGKGSIEIRTGSWYYITGNKINGGTLRIGLQDIDQNAFPDWAKSKCEYGVIENNNTEKVFINVRPGTKHVAIRNNVVNVTDRWAILLECIERGYDHVRKTEDIRIERNTVVSMGTKGAFLWLHGKSKDLVLKNNLYVAPNLKFDGSASAFAVQVTGGDLSSFKTINGNIWPSISGNNKQEGLQYVGSESIDATGYRTESEWDAMPQVGDDYYRSITLATSYQTQVGTVKVGSSIRKAA